MGWNGNLEKIDGYRWRIPRGEVPCMRTDAVVYASEKMIPQIRSDSAPLQAANVACIPGIVGNSLAMPDIHWGYGFPIGGVAAVDADEGSISPGGIGFDINCGVRLIKTNLTPEDIGDSMKELMKELYSNVPSGLGSKGLTKLGAKDLDDVLVYGSEWAVENGYGWECDLDTTEENGCMKNADPSLVSTRAKKRGLPQLGSLGSGNHFLEIDTVERIADREAAKAFGLEEGTVTITVHCGSRGCGHQIATDYVQIMERYVHDNRIKLPDRQLACAPLKSKEGEDYYKSMCCGANYAWANRQMIMHWIRESFEKVRKGPPKRWICISLRRAQYRERNPPWKEENGVLAPQGRHQVFAAGRTEIPQYRDTDSR